MKTFITCLILIITNSVFASGGSVGTMKTAQEQLRNGQGNMKIGQSNIIYNMGQKDGLVRYAHGQLVQGKWEVQEVTLPVQAVIENSEFVKALTESQVKSDWVELK